METATLQHRGVPTFIRALAHQAGLGGAFGYDAVGYELARNLAIESPYDAEDDQWETEIDKLADLLFDSDDDEPILAWFDAHYPKIMAIVPQRRRANFAQGVRRAFDDGVLAS